MSNNSTPFSFHSHFDSLSLQHQLPPSATVFQGSNQYGAGGSGVGESGAGSRKRKSSYEDISPLVMKTRTGIGLEEEIVFDRTMTMMMAGQRRLLEEQRLALQHQQQQQQQLQQVQQLQQQDQQIHQQQQQTTSQRGSSADALRRLFMVGKNQVQQTQHTQPQPQPEATPLSFANCAGEINGCEVNRIPGMRERYQAVIRPCTFCGRPECQFCAVNCASCEEMSCRACSAPSYEKSDVEFFCPSCRG